MKQLILLLTVAAVVGHSQAQGNRKCAANGEYCLTHSECCSGSCLSFSYKCVPVPPSASVGTTFVPVTVDTANRFGGDDGGASITQKSCAKNGEYCLTSSDCCSKSCLSFSYKCVQSYDLGTQILTQSGIPVQQPSSGGNSGAIETANRFGGSDSGNRQCTANGLYCFHSGECCSGACFKSYCATEIKLGVAESDLTRPSPANGPYVQVNSLDELITRFGGGGGGGGSGRQGGDSSVSASSKRGNLLVEGRADTEKNCAIVGEGCSRQEDCCSHRCHSYRRKCVT